MEDQNGDKCALIKIITTEKDFQFENGSLGISKVDKDHTAEIWVYLPRGSRRLTISHPELGQITYDFNTRIESARTYKMELTTDKVFTATFDDSHSQTLILNISPSNATVSINGNVEKVSNGRLEKVCAFGRYRYVIKADRYHSLEDTITICNEKESHVRNVSLKQAWGWLKIENFADMTDAKLYIDSVLIGNVDGTSVEANSGTHVIRIVKPLYETYEQEVIVNDSITNYIRPNLVSNSGNVRLNVADKEASIYIDDQFVAKGAFEGKLGTGRHIVECRHSDNHRPTKREIYVERDSERSYTLDSPSPIYGSVVISTNKVPVNVKLDDMDIQKTDGIYSNSKVLIGKHTIIVSQKGYKTETINVNLSEGEKIEKNLNMQAVVKVKFESKPLGCNLYIDGENKGLTPDTLILNSGKHDVKLTRYGYKDYSGNYKFERDEEIFKRTLSRIYYKKNEFYVEGGMTAGCFMAYRAAMGCYIKNVNIEAIYMGGLDKETVFLSNGDDAPPYELNFKVGKYIGGRIGYGINFGGPWRITPQIGGGCSSISCDNDYVIANSANATYVVTGTVGVKIQFSLAKSVSVTLTPEYSMAIKQGDTFKKLSEVSSKIKSWGTGFNGVLGINFYF